MVYVSDGLGLEVDDVDVGLRDVHDDDFAFIEHSEEVDDIGVFMLEEDIAIGINMDDTFISARVDHTREDEGIIKGRGEA